MRLGCLMHPVANICDNRWQGCTYGHYFPNRRDEEGREEKRSPISSTQSQQYSVFMQFGNWINARKLWLFLMVDMTHIQYQGETLPPPLVLAFHLVLGKF